MKITFIGAAHQVTGSCFLVETNGLKILVDCGMEQGPDIFERQSLSVLPSAVDCVLLTHAHIDHSGLLPMLYSEGFRGSVYTTSATQKLCDILLKDAAHIQQVETEWVNKRMERQGGEPVKPLYTMADAENVMKHFRPHEYLEEFLIGGHLKARFLDAGHLLGSAHIELVYEENGTSKTVLFSGDIGNSGKPLLNDPSAIEKADFIIMESTYGDREHEPPVDTAARLASVISQTLNAGGNVVIPSFAVGRCQEILYYIRQIKERGLVKGREDFKVYLDSPLAIEATNIFKNIDRRYYDSEALELLEKGINPINFEGLRLSLTSDDSKAINQLDEPVVIISASGMCEAGRIRHHLKYNLWRQNCTVLFVGFQVDGTLGHALLQGKKTVRLFGEEVAVNARIMSLENSSSHADKNALIDWLSHLKTPPERIFTVHGSPRACEMLSERIRSVYGYDAVCPYYGEQYDLNLNIKTANAVKRVVSRKKSKLPKKITPFYKLLEALRRLTSVVDESEGISNRDLEKFTRQIDDLSDKWKK